MKLLTTLSITLLALLCHPYAGAQIQINIKSDYEGGVTQHERGNLKMAIILFEQGASKGDPKSMFALGSYYHFGEGVPKDQVKARSLFEKSAAAGSAEANAMLGIVYREGQGVTMDKLKGFEYFKAAALACSDTAQEQLAQMLFGGEGVKEDKTEALAWLHVASKSKANSDAVAGVVHVTKTLSRGQVQAAERRKAEIEKSLKCPT